MIQPFVFLLLLVLTQAASPNYSQTYTILIKGAVSGTEKVNETSAPDGSTVVSSEHEIFLSDGLETKRMAFTTVMLLARENYSPLRYKFQYTSGESKDSYEVTVKDGKITRLLNRGGRSSETSAAFKPGALILDFSVYHHYDWLIRKYDLRKGGKQSFANFIPLVGSEIPLNVTFMADSSFNFGKSTLAVRNFRVEFVGLWAGVLSVDKNNRMVRLAIPAQDLEVVRKDVLENSR